MNKDYYAVNYSDNSQVEVVLLFLCKYNFKLFILYQIKSKM